MHRLCTAILVISPKLRTSADIWREKINGLIKLVLIIIKQHNSREPDIDKLKHPDKLMRNQSLHCGVNGDIYKSSMCTRRLISLSPLSLSLSLSLSLPPPPPPSLPPPLTHTSDLLSSVSAEPLDGPRGECSGHMGEVRT